MKTEKNYFQIILTGAIILLIINIISFSSRILCWYKIESDYFNLITKMMYFVISILYLAISFKTVSIWKLSFTSYIFVKYKKIVFNFIICTAVGIIYIIADVFQILNTNAVIVLTSYAYIFMSTIIMILLIFKELFNAGNIHKMNESVQEIIKKDYTLIINTMDIDYHKKDNNYYSFLKVLKTYELIELHKLLMGKVKIISTLELEIIKELMIRDKRNNTTCISNIQDINKYLEYIFVENNQELDLEICKYMNLNNNDQEKLVEIILKIMDESPKKANDLFNPRIQEMFNVNETLIDKVIVRCIYEPTPNRELFLLELIKVSLKNSAFDVIDNKIQINTDKEIFIHINLENVSYIVKNNDDLKELSFDRYDKFWSEVKNANNIDLLDYVQKEIYSINSNTKNITGIYQKDYFEALNKYEEISQEINKICNELEFRNDIIDYQKTPFNYKLNSKNIKFNSLNGEEKKEFNVILEKFKEELQNITKNRIKLDINIEFENNKFKNQIKNTKELSIEIFLKLYKYIIDDKMIDNSNLSKEFYISLRNYMINKNFIMHETLEVYLLNVHFKLQDKFMRKYGKNEAIHIKIDGGKKVPNLENELTFSDVFTINRAVTIIQYYIDNEKLPMIEDLLDNSNILISNIEAACEIIREKYEYLERNKKVTNTENVLQGYYDYKVIKFRSEGLENIETTQIINFPLELKFERRTVFWILLEYLLEIKTNLIFSNYVDYEKKIKELLDGILNTNK